MNDDAVDIKKQGVKPILHPEEETLLVSYLVEADKRGFPRNSESLLDQVQKIILKDGRETPFTNGRPGKKWLQLFLQRHPDLDFRQAETR